MEKNNIRDKYIEECKKIDQNCRYTAETHHIIANRNKNSATWYQLVPAVIAAVLGVLVVTEQFPIWSIWLGVISASVSAMGGVLNPLKEYYDHLNAAKNFTILKQDANSLHKTFYVGMTDEELGDAVRNLHDRYNEVIKFVPPTDEKAFKKSQERIKSKVHELDEE